MARFFPRHSNSILQSIGRLSLAMFSVAVTLTSLIALPRAEELGRPPEFIVGIAVVGLLIAFLLGKPAIQVLWARSRPLRYRNSPRWFADYAWDPQGKRLYSPLENGPVWLVVGLLVWSAVGYFVVLPASQGGWTPESTHTIWIGAALGLVLVGLGTVRVWRYIRYGTSTLVLADSPVLVGGLLKATFASSRPLTTIERFTVTSRCYRESTRRSSSGNRVKTTSVTCLGEQSVTLPPGVLQNQTSLDFEIEIPGQLPGTHLACARPTYWELEVLGISAGPDLKTCFLIPVYASRD